jgi:hypothetical protein
LPAWSRERLEEKLTVDRLAERAATSPRNFTRRFADETGLPPARAGVSRLPAGGSKRPRTRSTGSRSRRDSAIPNACAAASSRLPPGAAAGGAALSGRLRRWRGGNPALIFF